jgi:hypothetical protein
MSVGRTGSLVLAWLLALPGCMSSSSLENYDADTDAGTADSDGVIAADTGDTDASTPIPATYISVDGTLTITDGAVDTAASSLILGLWSDAEPLCPTDSDDARGAFAVDAATPAEAPVDVPLFGWWSLTLSPADPACSGAAPTELTLGIGAMDSRLESALAQQGYSADVADEIYGLYAANGTDDAFVFGVAGTPGNFAGTDAPVTSGPLPDGTYAITTLYLLPAP